LGEIPAGSLNLSQLACGSQGKNALNLQQFRGPLRFKPNKNKGIVREYSCRRSKSQVCLLTRFDSVSVLNLCALPEFIQKNAWKGRLEPCRIGTANQRALAAGSSFPDVRQSLLIRVFKVRGSDLPFKGDLYANRNFQRNIGCATNPAGISITLRRISVGL